MRRGASRAGHAVRGAATSGARRARAWTTWGGAGESGLSKAIELHFVNLAGDAAVTVALAGTVFAMPTDEARGEVAQFLLLTMAPFVLLAPFVGPLLDRFRHGRRWAIGTTLAVRAFLCWVLADAVVDDSAWLFPAALGCLVASKAYSITRASAVPRLLPPHYTLVQANSRNAFAGVVGMAVGGGAAGALARVGPEWALRFAFVVFVVATVLAIRLPERVDSSLGERDIDDTIPLPVGAGADGRRTPWQRLRARVGALPATLRAALVASLGTRMLVGFLTLFLTFLMREQPLPGVSATLVLALTLGAAGLGNATATLLGRSLGTRRPEAIVAAALIADLAMAVTTALFYSLWTLVALGLVTGLGVQLSRVGTDAIVQRDVPDALRTRVFAWCETALQMAWVAGGAVGIALPLVPELGFGVAAGLLGVCLLLSVRVRILSRQRAA
jgi:MFS family permease